MLCSNGSAVLVEGGDCGEVGIGRHVDWEHAVDILG